VYLGYALVLLEHNHKISMLDYDVDLVGRNKDEMQHIFCQHTLITHK